MKKIFFLLSITVACAAHAQSGDYSANTGNSIKIGVGYVHDFPGLNGLGAHAGYSFFLNDWMEGEFGLKHIQAAGYPRTQAVKEYTNATTLDFNLLFVPFHDDNNAIKIGGGYSFSFYNTRRSYPLYTTRIEAPSSKEPDWQVQDEKGRISGFGLIAEYEHYFVNNLSVGARMSLCKAYNNVLIAGPFAAIRF